MQLTRTWHETRDRRISSSGDSNLFHIVLDFGAERDDATKLHTLSTYHKSPSFVTSIYFTFTVTAVL